MFAWFNSDVGRRSYLNLLNSMLECVSRYYKIFEQFIIVSCVKKRLTKLPPAFKLSEESISQVPKAIDMG